MFYQIELMRSAVSLGKDDLNNIFVYKVHLSGNLVMEVSDEFNLLIGTLINGGVKKLVFDLTELKYIDSTGIGVFIGLAKSIRSKGGDIAFLNVNAKIHEVFHLVKLNEFIPFFRGDKQVVDHFFALKV